MRRSVELERITKETNIRVLMDLDGTGGSDVRSGIPFFDHMLTLFAAHGFFELSVHASGDLAVDLHHTVEDIGIVMGQALAKGLGDRKGIRRYGHAVTPMDDALAAVAIDLSNRPFLVCRIPKAAPPGTAFDDSLAREFFRSFAFHGGMNLHIQVEYGDNDHHILEAVFKSLGRALKQATRPDGREPAVRSTKGVL
jgi:imidazoleglycerol-phosphate dehydratase